MERFDGAAHWAKLSPEAQAEIGAIALELVVSWNCQEGYGRYFEETPLNRAGAAADELLIRELQSTFVEHIERSAIENADGEPLLPSRLGPVCRRCGCSELDACQPSCSWAEPDLCSACVQPAGEAA